MIDTSVDQPAVAWRPSLLAKWWPKIGTPLVFALGVLSTLAFLVIAGYLWPYQRTSLDMCQAGTSMATRSATLNAVQADLNQHLETGWEVERIQMSKYGPLECPTYFLRRR